jgi:hypothetical protein
MPSASRETASESLSVEGFEGRWEDLDGYTVGFETYTADSDLAPLMKGLPDDRCQCPHFGYVVKGSVTFRFADHEETYGAGEGYHAPPGHTPVLHAGSEIVEFSPTEALRRTVEVVKRNMEAAAG